MSGQGARLSSSRRGGPLGGRLFDRVADQAPGGQARLTRPPRPRAVLQPALLLRLIAFQPVAHAGFVTFKDGRDLRTGVAPAGQEHHAKAFAHPSDRAACHLSQSSSFALVQPPDAAHEPCSPPGAGSIQAPPAFHKNLCHLT